MTIRTVPLNLAFQDVRATCNQIARASRRLAPVNRTGWRRPGPHLRRTITATTKITGPTKVRGDVGSELNHALVAHRGAKPHRITPRSPGGTLRFYWTNRGRWVRLSAVNHPGMEGTPYLSVPLATIATARGYRVVLL